MVQPYSVDINPLERFFFVNVGLGNLESFLCAEVGLDARPLANHPLTSVEYRIFWISRSVTLSWPLPSSTSSSC